MNNFIKLVLRENGYYGDVLVNINDITFIFMQYSDSYYVTIRDKIYRISEEEYKNLLNIIDNNNFQHKFLNNI